MRDWWKEKDMIGFLPEKILTEALSLDEASKMILSDVTGHTEIECKL